MFTLRVQADGPSSGATGGWSDASGLPPRWTHGWLAAASPRPVVLDDHGNQRAAEDAFVFHSGWVPNPRLRGRRRGAAHAARGESSRAINDGKREEGDDDGWGGEGRVDGAGARAHEAVFCPDNLAWKAALEGGWVTREEQAEVPWQALVGCAQAEDSPFRATLVLREPLGPLRVVARGGPHGVGGADDGRHGRSGGPPWGVRVYVDERRAAQQLAERGCVAGEAALMSALTARHPFLEPLEVVTAFPRLLPPFDVAAAAPLCASGALFACDGWFLCSRTLLPLPLFAAVPRSPPSAPAAAPPPACDDVAQLWELARRAASVEVTAAGRTGDGAEVRLMVAPRGAAVHGEALRVAGWLRRADGPPPRVTRLVAAARRACWRVPAACSVLVGERVHLNGWAAALAAHGFTPVRYRGWADASLEALGDPRTVFLVSLAAVHHLEREAASWVNHVAPALGLPSTALPSGGVTPHHQWRLDQRLGVERAGVVRAGRWLASDAAAAVPPAAVRVPLGAVAVPWVLLDGADALFDTAWTRESAGSVDMAAGVRRALSPTHGLAVVARTESAWSRDAALLTPSQLATLAMRLGMAEWPAFPPVHALRPPLPLARVAAVPAPMGRWESAAVVALRTSRALRGLAPLASRAAQWAALTLGVQAEGDECCLRDAVASVAPMSTEDAFDVMLARWPVAAVGAATPADHQRLWAAVEAAASDGGLACAICDSPAPCLSMCGHPLCPECCDDSCRAAARVQCCTCRRDLGRPTAAFVRVAPSGSPPAVPPAHQFWSAKMDALHARVAATAERGAAVLVLVASEDAATLATERLLLEERRGGLGAGKVAYTVMDAARLVGLGEAAVLVATPRNLTHPAVTHEATRGLADGRQQRLELGRGAGGDVDGLECPVPFVRHLVLPLPLSPCDDDWRGGSGGAREAWQQPSTTSLLTLAASFLAELDACALDSAASQGAHAGAGGSSGRDASARQREWAMRQQEWVRRHHHPADGVPALQVHCLVSSMHDGSVDAADAAALAEAQAFFEGPSAVTPLAVAPPPGG